MTWSPIPVRAQTFYGRQHVLYAVACRDDGMAALGAKTGGVHGNPRTGTWVWGPGGPLREVPAAFELFGGPRAVSASRLAAGPGGWLVAGARGRRGGVVVAGRRGFVLHEGVAELAGDGRGRTAAYDVTAVGRAGWWWGRCCRPADGPDAARVVLGRRPGVAADGPAGAFGRRRVGRAGGVARRRPGGSRSGG
ncbi:hypothetical protein V2I01_01525 [Micromonospora sp. BRA006-A]|nr:hypothetical protein [Micromonospora sp. BRA006-A]